jgi:hypothetical protein
LDQGSVYTPFVEQPQGYTGCEDWAENMWCRLGAIPRCSCRFYEVRTRPHEVSM